MGARSRCSQWISPSQIRDLAKKWIRYRSIKSTTYNNNTHTMLEVNALLESRMQGLHSESLWWACCVGQQCVLIHTIVRKSLVKYCKTLTKRLPRRERVKPCRQNKYVMIPMYLFFGKRQVRMRAQIHPQDTIISVIEVRRKVFFPAHTH